MSLADDLAHTVDAVRSAVPGHVFDAIGASIADLHATGIADRAAGVGDRVTLPVLAHLDGAPFPLAHRLAGRPAVLVFYRGGWCPYCNVALRAYAAALPAIAAAGGTVVAVTPEGAGRAAETAGGSLGFPIALDRGNAFARALGLVFAVPESLRPLYREIGIDLPAWNGDASHELPVPATYVLDRDGVIRWAFVDADFTRRADPGDVAAALKRLQDAAA